MYCVGLPLQPLVQIAAVVDPGDLAQLFFGMRVEIAALALQRVHQQNFGGQARRGDGLVFQELGALEERGLDGHERLRQCERLRHLGCAASPCSFNFSV